MLSSGVSRLRGLPPVPLPPRQHNRIPIRGAAGAAAAAVAAAAAGYYIINNRRIAAAEKRCLYTRNIKDVVYMDFSIGSIYIGRILIGIYTPIIPITAENFIQLCQGFRVYDKVIGYRNTQVHKVQQGVALLAGGVLTGCGGEGMSIYGKKFRDENFSMQFIQDGDVAMLSDGPHSNNSKFIISFCPLPVLNNQHVVIGTVIKGMKTIRKIEDVGTKNGVPMQPVRIIGCGLYRGPQDGPPYFTSTELLDKAESPVLEEEEFLKLPADKQEELLQGLAAATGTAKKKRPYTAAPAAAPAATAAAAAATAAPAATQETTASGST